MPENYINEMIIAKNFILDHKGDAGLMNLIERCKSPKLLHSDRWSLIFDYFATYYPNVAGSVITGLAYLVETEDI